MGAFLTVRRRPARAPIDPPVWRVFLGVCLVRRCWLRHSEALDGGACHRERFRIQSFRNANFGRVGVRAAERLSAISNLPPPPIPNPNDIEQTGLGRRGSVGSVIRHEDRLAQNDCIGNQQLGGADCVIRQSYNAFTLRLGVHFTLAGIFNDVQQLSREIGGDT